MKCRGCKKEIDFEKEATLTTTFIQASEKGNKIDVDIKCSVCKHAMWARLDESEFYSKG